MVRLSNVIKACSIDKVVTLLIVSFLAGCATTSMDGEGLPEADADAPPATTDAAVAYSPPATRHTPEAATLALLNQSERAALGGSLTQALSYAERAVRIDPRSASLWTHLAALELQDGDADAAIQYANKAISLAPTRPDWQRDAWLVIADAHDFLGDTASALQIRRRWQSQRG